MYNVHCTLLQCTMHMYSVQVIVYELPHAQNKKPDYSIINYPSFVK